MSRARNYLIYYSIIIYYILIFSFSALANNLTITNVSLKDRNPSANTVVVNFNVSWENSWKSKISHDAIWLTVRLYNPSVSPTDKRLCQISANGLNPEGTSSGSNAGLEIYVPTDKKGAFLRPSSYSVNSSVAATDAQLKIDYSSCGFGDDDIAHVSVLGIEMVYVPQGAFYVGDRDISTAALDQGSTDPDPWNISSESIINVTNPATDGYRYVSNMNPGEDATSASFAIPAAFPKGFAPFYAMKYEITEGQWVEFVNSLASASARASRDITDNNHKNSDSVVYRNTVSCSGSPLTCSTQRPSRAANFLTWMDVVAFLDWAALRPMTELEFEKMARGPFLPMGGEYVWGSTTINAATTISGVSEDGAETITDSGANANYNNTLLSGGDTASGVDYQNGPLRVGIFASSSTDREQAGASYYGIMELSGNVRERVVTIGNTLGRNFIGSQGDGSLSSEGNANQSDWPGMDAVVSRGITGADGSGLRGGGWDDQNSGVRLRISDRYDAANASTVSSSNMGGRGVRTYDAN